jgi:hypothetical protein
LQRRLLRLDVKNLNAGGAVGGHRR